MSAKTPQHIVIPPAPRGTRVKAEVYRPYRPPVEVAPLKAKESPAPAAYELEPELREWLRTQVRILAYWESLPESHFVPAMPPATRARDAIILSALRRLLA
jgi:hypothetical protein